MVFESSASIGKPSLLLKRQCVLLGHWLLQSSHWIFLNGICLPLYVIHSIDAPLNIWDFISLAICLTGIVVAYYADTQLHEFVTGNQKLKAQGKPKIPNLDTGLWHYSRHPNYLGEQLSYLLGTLVKDGL